MRMNKRLVTVVLGLVCAMCIAEPAVFGAPPKIETFSFDEPSQVISFWATADADSCNFSIASSSGQTTFSAPKQGWSNAEGFGMGWYITPGGAAVGETHRFTVRVWDAHGEDDSGMCLEVVLARSPDLASPFAQVSCSGPGAPTLSEWGLIILLALLVIAGVIVARRRAIIRV